LLDISGKIDDVVAGALAHVKAAADSLGLSFFVIGALAREILLRHFYGLQTQRATSDLDLGVTVATWGDLFDLKDALIKEGWRYFGDIQLNSLIRSGGISVIGCMSPN
jgi:predicted nucleotidyltransferase